MNRNTCLILSLFILIPIIFNSCSSDEKGKVLPVVDFYAQSQGNLVGNKVNYFDKSTNQPTSWDWSFPGGTPSKSTLQNPVVIYNAAGKYNVSLTATNIDGSASLVKNEYVTIYQYDSFTDSRDGHIYKSLKIGNDVWMIENLNYQSTSGSYVYTFLSNYATLFGRVYDWETAKTVAPAGWHLPSDVEFTALVNYLGGSGVAGSKMKAGGTTLWTTSTSAGAVGTNLSGFNALPAGARYSGNFTQIYYGSFFWTATSNNTTDAWCYTLDYNESQISRNAEPKFDGMSVRCVKD